MVIKKDGRREPYDREKVAEGIYRACRKRPISVEAIDAFLDSLEQTFQDSGPQGDRLRRRSGNGS